MPSFSTIPVTSLDDDPRLVPYANQTDAWLKASHNPERIGDAPDHLTASGRFIAEGGLVVEQLLRSSYVAESLLLAESRVDAHAALLESVPSGVPIFVCEPETMDEITGFHIHRGVLACGIRGEPKPAEAISSRRIAVVMHDLANHDNVGGIFRSLAALAGADAAAYITSRTCDPFYRKALRVSIGHALLVPWAEIPSGPGGVESLRSLGYTTVALTTAGEPIDLDAFRPALGTKVALFAGAEGPGLDPGTIEATDLSVQIPIVRDVDSLNVTVAASIAVHHCARHEKW